MGPRTPDQIICSALSVSEMAPHFILILQLTQVMQTNPYSKREAEFTSQELHSNCQRHDRTHTWTSTPSETPTATRLGSVCFPKGILAPSEAKGSLTQQEIRTQENHGCSSSLSQTGSTRDCILCSQMSRPRSIYRDRLQPRFAQPLCLGTPRPYSRKLFRQVTHGDFP